MWLERELVCVIWIRTQALILGREDWVYKGIKTQKKPGVTSTWALSSVSGSLPMQPGRDIPPRPRHTLTVTSFARNTFSAHVSGTLQSTFFPAFSLKKAQSSAGAFNLPGPTDSMYVAAPLAGTIFELHPPLLSETGLVAKWDTITVLTGMNVESGDCAAR